MIVNVTKEDVRCGVRDNFNSCPVALALNRQCPGWTATVGLRDIHLWPDALGVREVCVPVAADVLERIIQFDQCGVLGPFSFEIPDLPRLSEDGTRVVVWNEEQTKHLYERLGDRKESGS